MLCRTRVDVADYKKNAGDFVLWKPSSDDEPGWKSPWGRGRPGWHIECSAMSTKYLGTDFDIHGGGADLKFPHHENEIAQSCCGNTLSLFAKTWIHNGFLTVNGEKMSKSLGNFITVEELLQKGVKGEVIRYVLLSTHYRKPLDFSDKSLEDAQKNLDTLYKAIEFFEQQKDMKSDADESVQQAQEKRTFAAYESFIAALEDDMNTPKALAELYVMAKSVRSLDATDKMLTQYKECAELLGILQSTSEEWLAVDESDLDTDKVQALVDARVAAKADKNWAEADRLRDELVAMGIELQDSADGTTWSKA